MLPLAELEARQLPLIQSCVIPKMLSPHDNVRKASAEAELKIDAHLLSCRCFVDSFLMGAWNAVFETDDRIFVASLSGNEKMFTGLSEFMLQRENQLLLTLNAIYSVW